MPSSNLTMSGAADRACPPPWDPHQPLIAGLNVWIHCAWQRPFFQSKRRLPFVQLLLPSEGADLEVAWRQPGKSWEPRLLKDGEIWLQPAGLEQMVRGRAAAGLFVAFSPESAVADFCGRRLLAPEVYPVGNLINRTPAIAMLWEDLQLHQSRQKSMEPKHIAAAGTALFSFILRSHFARALGEHPSAADRAWQQTCRRLEDHMARHLAEKFSLARLATVAGMGRWYLCAVFKAKTRFTLRRYFNRLRALRAREMLRHGSTRKEAMHAIGITTAWRLKKLFREHLHCDPAVFIGSPAHAIASRDSRF